jgi:hypothetical protein
MEKKWDTVAPADLKKTLYKWEIYVPLVTKGLTNEPAGCQEKVSVRYLALFIHTQKA